MVYASASNDAATIENLATPQEKRETFSLSQADVVTLGKWCLQIEQHYGRPMDIEWAKDGPNGPLYIVQARPETVYTGKGKHTTLRTYKIKSKGKVLAEGIALGEKIACGKARLLSSPQQAGELQEGEVLVTDITNPDWDPIM